MNFQLSLIGLLENIISDNKKGQMVAHFIPVPVAKSLRAIGSQYIGQSSNLADMHITLGLVRDEKNRKKDILNCLRIVSQYIDPFEVDVSKFEVFPPNDSNENMEVLVARPESDQFKKVHELLFDVFEKFKIPIDNGSFDFKPHITIKYCKPGQNIDIASIRFNQKIKIDSISFEKNGQKKNFQLGERN